MPSAWPHAEWDEFAPDSETLESHRELRLQMAASLSFALHVSKGGTVVADLGATDVPVRCQSIRKALMNGLIGVAVTNGMVSLDETIGDLDIDDIDSLSAVERSATVRHLLEARSGIYHPAAAQQNPHPLIPQRHSSSPGTRWAYNNWDFNALGTILRKVTGKSTAATFDEWFARPLAMQEFAPDSCSEAPEDMSVHPAYRLRISARDLARYGLLYLRLGMWEDTELLPPGWITDSIRPQAKATAPYDGAAAAFGRLWWIGHEGDMDGRPWYAALGGMGHVLAIIPSDDVVIVHRNLDHLGVPTWDGVLPLLQSARRLAERFG
jgi:CubicO group peptidase (beta-lactamase class C family)